MFKFRTYDLKIWTLLCVTLKTVYGMGWHKVIFVPSKLGISLNIYTGELNVYFKDILFYFLNKFTLTNTNIERYNSLCIRKLKELYTYRGVRHLFHLPVHGQRTRTNANTQRSKRRIIENLKKQNEKPIYKNKKKKK